MPELFGRRWTAEELGERVGRMDQAAGVRPFVFEEGPGRGMRGLDVWTGSGLTFTVLPDRGMDMGDARFAGRALAWQSSTGPVSPERYEPQGLGWLRSFYGGLLTTCGLRHFGAPDQEAGETWGLHGRVSHLSAQDVSVDRGWEGDAYRLRLQGRLVEAEVFKPTLVLERTIETWLGAREVRIADRVTNAGYLASTAMLLYHVNLGWPLLAEGSRFLVSADSVEPRDERAAAGIRQYAEMAAPTPAFEEQVYLINPKADAQGLCCAALVNRDLDGGLAVSLTWPKATMPCLTEWKMMGRGTYVVGIEPCNAPLWPRDRLRREGRCPELGPGESFETSLTIRVHVGTQELAGLEAGIRQGMSRER